MTLFNERRQLILDMICKPGESLSKPNDDWLNVLFLFCPSGTQIIGMPLSSIQDKDAMAPAIVALFREYQPTFAAFLISCWTITLKADTPLIETNIDLLNEFGVRNHPNREEALMVELGDSHKTEVWQAKINRTSNLPPSLGKWHRQDFTNSQGRMANLLSRAFDSLKTKGIKR